MPQTSIIFLKSFIPVPSARISRSKCFPPPSKKFSKYAPIIHVMKVMITYKYLSSLEKSKAIISNLTMVPTVGDIYRNCEIKSIAPYGFFVEISPGREGLCHISELSTCWLAKVEDAVKIGDTIDVKLIEINGKGQLRLSRRALFPDSNIENSGTKQLTVDLIEESTEKGKQNSVTRAVEVENAELSNEIKLLKILQVFGIDS